MTGMVVIISRNGCSAKRTERDTHKCAHIHTCTNTHTCTHTHTYIHTHIHTYTCTCNHILQYDKKTQKDNVNLAPNFSYKLLLSSIIIKQRKQVISLTTLL